MNTQEAMRKLNSLPSKVYLEHIKRYGTIGTEELECTIVEAIAKKVYARWHIEPGYVMWQEGGNSDKQEQARDIARAFIRAYVSDE